MYKFLKVGVIVGIFCIYWSSYGAFSLGGSTITQTGTDTDLSWLSAISWVTTTTTWAWADSRTVYDIGNRNLVVNGNLTISPEIEWVYAGTSSPRSVFRFSWTSTVTINGEIIENGVSRYSEYLFMWSPYQNGNCCNNFWLEVDPGATFNWNGWKMRIGSSLRFESGSNINITGWILEQDKNSDNQLRMETNGLVTEGFTFRWNDITFIAIPNQLNNYEPQWARWALGFSSATPNFDFPIFGYTSNGSNTDLRMWQWSRPILTNSDTWTRLNLVPHISGNGSSYWVTIVQQEVEVIVNDNEWSSVENAIVFTKDTDNWNREIYNRESHTVDATADNIYTQTTSSTGSTWVYQIITWYNISNSWNNDPVNTGNYAWDYRGKNNDDTDLFDFHIWSYNYNYNKTTWELKGTQTKLLSPVVTEDLSISESDQTVVNTYTDIDNLNELYDVVKNWKTQSSNLELPNIETLPVNPNAGTLEVINNYDVILDPLASDIFSLDTVSESITIRTSTLACWPELDNLVLQGSWALTLLNSASISCPYVDANANSLVTIKTPLPNQTIKVYSSLADMNSDSSPISTFTSWTDSQAVYRYNSWASTIYIKAFIDNLVDKWSMRSYVLNSWNNNFLDMGSGWDFTFVEVVLNQIKGTWFVSAQHSLKASFKTGAVITESDKNDIASRVKIKVEEDGWLLKAIYDLLVELRTRIVSIKEDTQAL